MDFTEDQIQRYARHIILPEIGGTGQAKLLQSRVLVVGAGGLGRPVVQALNTVNIANGIEAGLSIVILAIILDRLCKRPAARSKAG